MTEEKHEEPEEQLTGLALKLTEFAEWLGQRDKELLDKFRFNKNLLADSNYHVDANSYPLTTYFFAQLPKEGETYRFTMKAKLGEGKTAWGLFNGTVPLLRIEGNTGKDGLFKGTLKWSSKGGINNLIVYAFPSAVLTNSQIEWVKLEHVKSKEDEEWLPRYDEIINHGGMVTEVSQMIAGSGNLLENSLAERAGKNELLIYDNIADIIDRYGLGIYTVSFDIRAPVAGTIRLYDAGVTDDKLKYRFGHNDFAVTTEYQRVTKQIVVRQGSAGGTLCNLTFYGMKYGNGVIPQIKRFRISKGLYEYLEWRPSEREMAGVFEKLL